MRKLSMIFGKKKADNVNRRVKPKATSGSKRIEELKPEFPYMTHLASAMTLVVIVVVMGWYFNKATKVNQVEIKGNFFTEAESIIGQMAIPEGARADSLNFLGIIETVEAMPYIKQAFINRSPSGRIQVRVKEREPIALLIESEGRTYVDSDGLRLPARLGKTVDVPLLYATHSEMKADTLNGPVFSSIAGFLQAAHENGPAQITLSEIAWSENEGVIALSHDNGYRLIFGNEDFDDRLNKWMAFYTDKILDEGVNRINSIDFRFEGQIVTR